MSEGQGRTFIQSSPPPYPSQEMPHAGGRVEEMTISRIVMLLQGVSQPRTQISLPQREPPAVIRASSSTPVTRSASTDGEREITAAYAVLSQPGWDKQTEDKPGLCSNEGRGQRCRLWTQTPDPQVLAVQLL